MAKSLIAAVLIAIALVGAVVVPTALTRGTFAFDAWPEASRSHAQREDVAIAEPAKRLAEVRFEHAAASPSAPAARPAHASAPRNQLAQATPHRPAPSAPAPHAQDAPATPAPQPADEPQQAPVATPVQEVAQSGPPAAGGSSESEARPVQPVLTVPPPIVGVLPPSVRGDHDDPGLIHIGHVNADDDDQGDADGDAQSDDKN
jgi:FtsZ-interacting cell division protein ZipA